MAFAGETHGERTPSSVVIVGNGPVGTALAKLLTDLTFQMPVFLTHRRTPPSADLQEKVITSAFFDAAHRTLESLEPTLRLSHDVVVVWTFPTGSAGHSPSLQNSLDRAVQECLDRGCQLLLLSSTGCYKKRWGWVQETDERDLQNPRFEREEHWRRKGAMILPLAGLFGGSRSPLNWLEQGRIKDFSKPTNLVHHDDVAYCLAQVVQHPLPGELVNISSGELHFWPDVARECGRSDLLRPGVGAGGRREEQAAPPRRISNSKLLMLYPQLRHHSFRRFPGETTS